MKIALTFSGGGYRAAAFSLGTLSFLDKLVLNKRPFLDSIEVLSTVSGGTITGARYAVGRKRGENFEEIYDSLVHFMSDSKLVKNALERLSSKENWPAGRVRSLVTSFADIYDSELFDHEKFAILMDEENEGIAHLSFNATEFANALQFRFQWTEKVIGPSPEEGSRGIIGNNFYNIPPSVAKEIRMADIMAASSCFPGGFEPINFPSDFVLPAAAVQGLPTGVGYPVGLMDGGIVDNQGIMPVILARDRMYRNHIKAGGDPQVTNLLDLILISDVASPYVKEFQASHQNKKGWWKFLTPRLIIGLNSLLLIGSALFLVHSIRDNHAWGAAFAGGLTAITLVLLWIFRKIHVGVKASGVPNEFLKPISQLLKIKLYVYQSLLLNRVNSLLMLSMDVFLKHVRRLNYESLYGDKDFKNRRIMSAIYELRHDEHKIDKKVSVGKLPAYLLPGKLIRDNSDFASSMGTTLWFSEQELEQGMLNAIIACGQYTSCWNLLEYIEEIKVDPTNTSPAHQYLVELEPALKECWKDFQADPLCMV